MLARRVYPQLDGSLQIRRRVLKTTAGRASVAVAIIALLRGVCIAQGGGGVGIVSEIEGGVTLVHNGRAIKLKSGMVLENNDQLVTQSDGHVTISFGDKSTLTLGESATVVVNEGMNAAQDSISRVGLLGGHLHTIFNAGLRGIGAGFEVRTPNAIIGVRGTEFKTAYITGTPCPGFPNCTRYTDVGVIKGRVEVRNPLNPKATPVIAATGFETTVPCEEPPAAPSPLGLDQMLAPGYK
jgi:hypothetical protein